MVRASPTPCPLNPRSRVALLSRGKSVVLAVVYKELAVTAAALGPIKANI